MDPTILKPPSRFALPAQRGVSRSPSRSPIRNQHVVSRGLEPLLSDLSPTSTLKALQSADTAEAPASPNASLIDSAISASTSERAWGIKAALAGKKVRDWYKELEAWPWPSAAHDGRNGFEPLAGALQEGREETAEGGPEELQYGSLPAWTAQEYEQRIEEIRDDLETLELEELKAHVRAMHLSTDPRRSTYGQFDAGLINGYAQLDDFTAIMTSTIMQTLPDVSRLNALLGIWSIRLVVSRQVPGFLDCIEETQTAMDSAWKAVGEPRNEGPRSESDINREAFMTMRGVLEKQIHELGQRLDSMLDALEGREDTVPEPWIDRMEAVEADFETWAVQTEQRVLEGELLAARARPRSPATPARRHSDEDGEISSHLRNMLSSREASAEKTHARVYSLGNNTFEPHSKPRPLGLNLSRPQTPVEGPINSDFSSDYSYPGSATSGSFSNMSSPEIQQASRAEYFGAPVEITSPNLVQKDPMSPSDTISRQSSQRTERGNPDTDDIASGTRSRASSFMPEPAILEDGPPVESRPSDIEQSMFRHFAELNDQGSPTHDQPKSSSNDEPSMVGREHAETMYGTPLKRTKPRNKFEDAAVVAPGKSNLGIR